MRLLGEELRVKDKGGGPEIRMRSLYPSLLIINCLQMPS